MSGLILCVNQLILERCDEIIATESGDAQDKCDFNDQDLEVATSHDSEIAELAR